MGSDNREGIKTDQETQRDAFRRVTRGVLGWAALECDSEATPLQKVCQSYLRSEQAWLNKMLQTRHVRQPGIIYGFYESPDELQAFAIERHGEPPGFIAISSYCVISFGTFFRAALAHRNVLSDFGEPNQELSPDKMAPGPHLWVRPQDPDRLVIAKLLTMMAMRFLTAHEMTHILNGHIRHRLAMKAPGEMAEAKRRLSPKEALFSQTLEMDADSGAVVECMPGVIFAEREPEEPIRIGCHVVYQKPEAALRLWLFAMYGVFRVMEDDAVPIPIDEASHPSPMMRVRMVMSTLFEFLKREQLDRLLHLLPGLIEQATVDGEVAFASISNQPPDLEPIKLAESGPVQARIETIIREWRHVRPIIEPFHRGGGKLAPLPAETQGN